MGNYGGQIYMVNTDTSDNFCITLLPPAGASFSGSSAEWILEAPNGGFPNTELPAFTPVEFTSAVACNSSATSHAQDGNYVNIVNGNQTLTSATPGDDAVTIGFIG
jgi:hypothetical protein